MTTATPLHPKAQTGRRVEFTYYRDLHKGLPPHPGIITDVDTDLGMVRVRLDGERSTLNVRHDFEGLTYLDEVTEVPALPMGRFTPTVADLGGFEWEGVPVCEIADDALIALTINRVAAVQALNAYLVLVLGIHDAPIHGRDVTLRYGIGVFEWEPEDADTPWSVRLVPKPDPTTVHLHHITL